MKMVYFCYERIFFSIIFIAEVKDTNTNLVKCYMVSGSTQDPKDHSAFHP